MRYLVLSTSLHEDSRSRLLCRVVQDAIASNGGDVAWLDLRELGPPICDGLVAWDHPGTLELKRAVAQADGIVLGLGIYNYGASAAAKTAVELGGDAWSEKVVGFACAAGGDSSMMAPLGLANSLMLDFRSVIVPRFVYATGHAFAEDGLADERMHARLEGLAADLQRMTVALRSNVESQSSSRGG